MADDEHEPEGAVDGPQRGPEVRDVHGAELASASGTVEGYGPRTVTRHAVVVPYQHHMTGQL